MPPLNSGLNNSTDRLEEALDIAEAKREQAQEALEGKTENVRLQWELDLANMRVEELESQLDGLPENLEQTRRRSGAEATSNEAKTYADSATVEDLRKQLSQAQEQNLRLQQEREECDETAENLTREIDIRNRELAKVKEHNRTLLESRDRVDSKIRRMDSIRAQQEISIDRLASRVMALESAAQEASDERKALIEEQNVEIRRLVEQFEEKENLVQELKGRLRQSDQRNEELHQKISRQAAELAWSGPQSARKPPSSPSANASPIRTSTPVPSETAADTLLTSARANSGTSDVFHMLQQFTLNEVTQASLLLVTG